MNKILTGGMMDEEPNQLEKQAQLKKMAELLRLAKTIECEECKNKNFLLVYRIKKISGLLTGTGKDIIVPIAVYACSDCGHINSDMSTHLHDDEKQKENAPEENNTQDQDAVL